MTGLLSCSFVRKTLLFSVFFVFLTSESGFAGGTNVVARTTKGITKPSISTQPVVIGTVDSTNSSAVGKPARPGAAANGNPAAVNALISKLQSDRQSFLAAQKEIRLKQMTDNSAEARALLRQEMNEALQKWKADRLQFVEEQRERAKSIKSELHTDMGRLVDGAVGVGAGGRGR